MSRFSQRYNEDKSSGVVQLASPERSPAFRLLKRVLRASFSLLVLRRLLVYRVANAMLGRRAFSASSESIARVPGLRGVYLRQAFYSRTLSYCGQDVYFGWNSVFSMTEAGVGDRVYIGRYCSIGFGEIGEGAMLADGVQVLSGGHEHGEAREGVAMQDQPQSYHRVRIGRDVWIGTGAVIMADIGDGCVIGAGAVVTRPVPPGSLAVGVPARVVRTPETESP